MKINGKVQTGENESHCGALDQKSDVVLGWGEASTVIRPSFLQDKLSDDHCSNNWIPPILQCTQVRKHYKNQRGSCLKLCAINPMKTVPCTKSTLQRLTCMKENLLLITAKKTHGKQGSCSKRSVYYANEEVQFISKPRQQRSSLFMDADQDLIDMESSECE